ncbi:MAG TPA: 50S ribosomal protein L24 [Pseudomonadales bacterium]|mgnify:CR=1 FL=1|nr:50S ribosomal protein L24 [Pseudomonadales bacterium]HND13408.1 50S ribosomal protein L24 [Pseudomonadales bacterium]
MAKIRRNDEVIVITGKDRGKHGRVVRVLDDDRVIVAGVNMVKRHTRANPQAGTAGGIVEKEASVHVSNVALVNPTTGKADRVGYKVLADKTKVRVFRSSGELIDG